MSAPHTPGPWEVYHRDGYSWEIATPMAPQAPSVHIANAQGEANANLIAASPDLLAALREARAYIDGPELRTPDRLAQVIRNIDAAIAKTEGRA